MKVCERSRCEFERSCGIPEPGRLCNLETLGAWDTRGLASTPTNYD